MDTIADYLTAIRNALKANHKSVTIKSSTLKEKIAHVLQEKGYIESYQVHPKKPQNDIELVLKYNAKSKKPAITSITRISKCSRRQYRKAAELPHVLNGLGIAIISTSSQGVITDKEARKLNIGGEEICHVY